ncbi:hypothetical protein ElyMa_002246500 [Elysia marginata]|uniref:Uncharacterized protein n=1 Tax=Elysia marginata TaxID=1093978 RepID=A0AAV4FXD6_9GAST|nr:hypothetical protein ElyMa_002246500 [Elysia marginata]
MIIVSIIDLARGGEAWVVAVLQLAAGHAPAYATTTIGGGLDMETDMSRSSHVVIVDLDLDYIYLAHWQASGVTARCRSRPHSGRCRLVNGQSMSWSPPRRGGTDPALNSLTPGPSW